MKTHDIAGKPEHPSHGHPDAKYSSELNGELEVCVVNGIKTLNSAAANYSYGGLHKVFQKAFSSARIAEKKPGNVLILGFGAGSIATILQEELRIECSIIGVEYDPVVLRIFHEHFDPSRFEKLELHNEDAFRFMARHENIYDLICIDIFNDKEIPPECTSPGFLRNVNRSLASKGTLLFNLIAETGAQMEKTESLRAYFRRLKGKLKEKFVAASNIVLIWEKA